MGALPKPDLPAGPVRALFDALHDLHHRAGWPSLREMAAEVGCSHTTVSAAFSSPKLPRWGLLELIVETLDGDPAAFHRLWLSASRGEHGGSVPATVEQPDRLVPRQLPPDVAGFTGRADHLDELDRLLADDGASAGVVVAAVSGTAGVGKTALAVHWAHRVADAFPDGQLYLDLRGYDSGKPVSAAEALASFLRGLGVADAAVPTELAERAARYRTLLARRRMLVLLDNAHAVEQVRDLLPGTSTCFVVVTSRDTLPALVARHGAVRMNLDLLERDEALALLRRLVGARVDAEPDDAATLVEQCARLPLAVRIAAELASARPSAPLADLVAELDDERHRLDVLAAGTDEHTTVRAVFSWSHRHLDDDASRLFPLLGLHPGRSVGVTAVAALADLDRGSARRALDALWRAHLVEEVGPGRFGMHDLLRAYAAERASGGVEAERQAAVARLYDHYLDGAVAATELAFPSSGTADPGAADARAWLDAERTNLLAVAEDAVGTSPAYVGRLAGTLARYLDAAAHYGDAYVLHQLALTAARSTGDRAAEAAALDLLGRALRRLGRYAEALDHERRAAATFREVGDRAGEGRALHGLGIVCWRLGRYAEAREHLTAALALRRELGDRSGQGSVLYALGIVYRRLGRYGEALDHYQQSVALCREIGDRAGEGRAMSNLGIVYLRLGRAAEAFEHYRATLALAHETGDPVGTGVALTNLALSQEALGRYDDALATHEEALGIYRDAGYRVGLGDAARGLGTVNARLGRYDTAVDLLREAVDVARDLGEADLETGAGNDLGRALRAAGRLDEAVEQHESALAVALRTGDRYEQARAHEGLGDACAAAGSLPAADDHWHQALRVYSDLGVPDADVLRSRTGTQDAEPDPQPDPSPGSAGAQPTVPGTAH